MKIVHCQKSLILAMTLHYLKLILKGVKNVTDFLIYNFLFVFFLYMTRTENGNEWYSKEND